MKETVKKWLPIIDILLCALLVPAAVIMKTVRRFGVHRLPWSRKVLDAVGVFPVRNHYYEPQFVFAGDISRFSKDRSLPGIQWDGERQAEFLPSLTYAGELHDLPHSLRPAGEYYLTNGNFEAGDAEFLYQFVRHFKPGKIIEIGSGYSTLMAAKALKQNRLEAPTRSFEHICVEPFEMPWLEQQGVKVIRKMVEAVGMELFLTLEAGDMLFIDSSHMIRPEGDVLFEYLELLPQLKPGVLVHVHDIFSPRNYPKSWLVDEVRLWNEQYLLEAYLSDNPKWEIVAGLNYLHHHHSVALRAVCPYLTDTCEPGSFYLRKKA